MDKSTTFVAHGAWTPQPSEDTATPGNTDQLRIRCLMHVPFEGAGAIEDWARMRGHQFSVVRLFDRDSLPVPEDFDLLAVMGGPMSVHDESEHPWLVEEKSLITRCLQQGVFVLGVCLGSQLLAECLGSLVRRNAHREIGWFPVNITAGEESLLHGFPDELMVFHWHGETYDLPPATAHRAASEGCLVQVFEHASALGLQFHLEVKQDGVEQLLSHCGNEIGPGAFQQDPSAIRSGQELHGEVAQRHLFKLLDAIGDRLTA